MHEEPANAARLSGEKRTLRGSGLLLIGQLLSMLINLATQVLIVRLLAREDFGAFAYALSFVVLGAHLSMLGTDKAVSRFVPLYHEREEHDKMAGTIIMIVALIIAISGGLILALFATQHLLGRFVVSEPLSLTLVLILILLTPFQALDTILVRLLAIFVGARAVFVRRHLVGPLLKLAAVLPLVLFGPDVKVFAFAYLAAGITGTVIAGALLWTSLRQSGLSNVFRPRKASYPVRSILGFSTPLLATETVFVLRTWFVTFLLEIARGAASVAAYRAVFPLARLNAVVMETFKLMYTPEASRLHARGDHVGLGQLYWRHTVWIALLAFPLFAVCFGLAGPLSVLLFGQDYADAGGILAVLSFGFYTNSAFGCNALTLRAIGKVRQLARNDLIVAVIAIGLTAVLVPWLGALGGAIAFAATMILQNVAHQWTLSRHLQGRRLTWVEGRVFASIAGGVLLLSLVQLGFGPSLTAGLLSVGGVIVAVLLFNLKSIDALSVFPELKSVSLFRRWLAPGKKDLV